MSVDEEGAVPWRTFYEEARARLAAVGGELPAVDARRIIEEASGAEPGEFAQALDRFATERGVAHFDHMLQRRLTGEPLRPRGELIDPRAAFEEDYLRRQAGQRAD